MYTSSAIALSVNFKRRVLDHSESHCTPEFIALANPKSLVEFSMIRNNTFRKSKIQPAFEKSGMWPLNATKCIQQLRPSSLTFKKRQLLWYG